MCIYIYIYTHLHTYIHTVCALSTSQSLFGRGQSAWILYSMSHITQPSAKVSLITKLTLHIYIYIYIHTHTHKYIPYARFQPPKAFSDLDKTFRLICTQFGFSYMLYFFDRWTVAAWRREADTWWEGHRRVLASQFDLRDVCMRMYVCMPVCMRMHVCM